VAEKAPDDISVDYAQIKKVIEQPNAQMIAVYGPQLPAEPEPETESGSGSEQLNKGLLDAIELSNTFSPSPDA